MHCCDPNALCPRSPSPPLDNIQVMVIVWRLRGNIVRTTVCWIVWHNVYSPQHTYMSSSNRSDRLGLSHWDPYPVHRGGCLELYYCNMEWFWWDSSLISTTNWFPSVLWYCWFGHLACKNRPWNDLLCVEWDIKPYTLTHIVFQLQHHIIIIYCNRKIQCELHVQFNSITTTMTKLSLTVSNVKWLEVQMIQSQQRQCILHSDNKLSN